MQTKGIDMPERQLKLATEHGEHIVSSECVVAQQDGVTTPEPPHYKREATESELSPNSPVGLRGIAGVIAHFGLLTVFAAVIIGGLYMTSSFMFTQFDNQRTDWREEKTIAREERKLEREIRDREVLATKEYTDVMRRVGTRIDKAADKLDALLGKITEKDK